MYTSTITVGYLPMPERTHVELKADYDQLQAQLESLVNKHSRTNTPSWVIADYRDIRRKQMAIEADIKQLFNNN